MPIGATIHRARLQRSACAELVHLCSTRQCHAHRSCVALSRRSAPLREECAWPGALPVTAARPASAELAGVAHGCASSRASPPRPPTAIGSAVPAAGRSRRRPGHYGNDQPRGLGMVTNAGSQLAANGDRSHTRVTFDGAADRRLPDIANSGLPPESRPGIVRLIRHAPKNRKTSGREGNTRGDHLEAEHPPCRTAAGPDAAGCMSAPRARKHRSVSSGRVIPPAYRD